jgi:Raf kinase inhibitor-like YbhB/YbcL family protein
MAREGIMQMKSIERALLLGIIVLSFSAAAIAQAPPAGAPAAGASPGGAPPAGRRGPPRPAFWVSSTAWEDGGVIPLKNAGRGDNKSPAFEFHWNLGTDPGPAPDTLQTYVVILHDIQNSSNKGTGDTLHWSAFNIPGTAKGLPEGIASGDLPDGTRNGPGIRAGSYFGPGAGPGPFHHYVFEFYALDTKLDLPATATRDDLLKAMEGHVIGKAAYFGRFPAPGE